MLLLPLSREGGEQRAAGRIPLILCPCGICSCCSQPCPGSQTSPSSSQPCSSAPAGREISVFAPGIIPAPPQCQGIAQELPNPRAEVNSSTTRLFLGQKPLPPSCDHCENSQGRLLGIVGTQERILEHIPGADGCRSPGRSQPSPVPGWIKQLPVSFKQLQLIPKSLLLLEWVAVKPALPCTAILNSVMFSFKIFFPKPAWFLFFSSYLQSHPRTELSFVAVK